MKKGLLIVPILVVVIAVVAGLVWRNSVRSPEYSLHKIQTSIADHDVTTFEKYVDLDGVLTRLVADVPDILSGGKVRELLGEELTLLLSGMVKASVLDHAKTAVRSFIERGRLDAYPSAQGPFGQSLAAVPLSTFKSVTLEAINEQGKICRVSLKINVGACDGDAILEIMMRDKGGFWQVAEISNMTDFISQIAELKRTFPYRNMYGAALHFAGYGADYARVAAQAAKLRDFDQAMNIASVLPVSPAKLAALVVISTEMAKAGQSRESDEVFEQVREIIKSAADIEERQEMMGELVEMLSRGVLDDCSDEGLVRFAIEFCRGGRFDEAFAIFADAFGSKQYVCKDLAEEFAKAGQCDWALSFAQLILVGDERRAASMTAIGCSLAEMGDKTRSRDMFEMALEEANSIADPRDKFLAILEVTSKLREKDMQEESDAGFAKAKHAMDGLSGTEHQYTAMRDIVEELTWRGDFSEAQSLSNEIVDIEARDWAFYYVATRLADTGEIEKAMHVTDMIVDEQKEAYALASIARGLSKNGEFADAMEVAGKIRIKLNKEWVLYSILKDLCEAGEVNRALEIVRSLGPGEPKAKACEEMAPVLVKLGERSEAVGLLSYIEKPQQRTYALKAMATAYVESGDCDNALALAMSNVQGGGEILKTVVVEMVRAGKLEEAVSAADGSRFSNQAFEGICIELAEEKRFDDALAVAGKMSYRESATETFYRISLEALKAIPVEERPEMAKRIMTAYESI